MATYTFNKLHYYYGGWASKTSGAGYTAGISNTSYRTILEFTITPASGEKITTLNLRVGMSTDSTYAMTLGGYLYLNPNMSTLQSKVNAVPSGYTGSVATHSQTTNASGANYTLSWSGLNITSATTVAVWLYAHQNNTSQTSRMAYIYCTAAANMSAVQMTGTASSIIHTITYNANGGTGAPAAQTYTYATSGVTYLSNTIPTRTGYDFLGWSLSSTATSPSYSAGQAWSLSNNADYILYAVWRIKTYNVHYNVNGGSGSISSQVKTHGTALTLSYTQPTPPASTTRTGYTITFNANGGSCSISNLTSTITINYPFSHWNTAANGGGTSYASGASYTTDATVTLYAQYFTQTVNGAITLPTPTRANYEFKGWATSPTATSGSFGSYVPTGNVSLYAIWGLAADAGLVYIDNGSSWDAYEVYIDNGSSWDKYIPYIDNGTSWDLYS